MGLHVCSMNLEGSVGLQKSLKSKEEMGAFDVPEDKSFSNRRTHSTVATEAGLCWIGSVHFCKGHSE